MYSSHGPIDVFQDLDFWGEPVIGRDLHIHVTPAVEEEFVSGLELMNLYFEAQVHDLQM